VRKLKCTTLLTLIVASPVVAQVNNTGTGNNQNDQNSQNNQTQNQQQNDESSTVAVPQYVPLPQVQSVDISGGSGNQSSDTDDDASSQKQQQLGTVGTQIKKPAKPSEFELYVQDAVGHKVPRFGSELLVNAQRDFAVPAQTTIPPDYALNVGDTVSVSLTGSVQGSANFTIDNSGRIFLPKIGPVTLIGVRYRDLKDRIAEAIGRQYRGYDVSVSIKKLRGIRVYVTGFANNPGAYSVNSLSTLVNAVLAAGGPNAGGSFRSVSLIRNGHVIADFDLYHLLRRGNRSDDPLLQNGDVIFIPPVGDQVAVIGSVNDEGIYEAKPGEALSDLLADAGGPDVLGDQSRAILYRLSDKEKLGSRELSRQETEITKVEGGDILQILSKGSLVQPLERQQVMVRIEGEVDRPGNYYVRPNTPLSTVLQMAGGLTPRAYVYGTKLTRLSVQAQQRTAYKQAIDQMQIALSAAPLTSSNLPGTSDEASQRAAAQAVLNQLRTAQPDGRLVLQIPYSATSLPSDLVLENNDHIVIPPMIRTVGVFGSVYRPASFLLDPDNKLRVKDLVEKAGGVQRQGDKGNIFVVRANGEVITRSHGAMSATVRPGDVVFVPIKVRSSSLFAKITAISQLIFQLGIGALTIAAIQ
jgi:protein involved in polysaccharide export with SLBB domain